MIIDDDQTLKKIHGENWLLLRLKSKDLLFVVSQITLYLNCRVSLITENHVNNSFN